MTPYLPTIGRVMPSSMRWPILVIVALGLTSCYRMPPQSSMEIAELRGCWDLEVEAKGAEMDSLRRWLPAGSLPPVFELDTVEVAGSSPQDSLYRAHSWFNGRRETAPFSVWQPIPADSIRIQQKGALSGLMLRMTPSGRELVGRVVGFSDVRRGNQTDRQNAPVTAGPTACPNQ